jgi:DNA-binding winged helix-turn-helix (wHTH) protein
MVHFSESVIPQEIEDANLQLYLGDTHGQIVQAQIDPAYERPDLADHSAVRLSSIMSAIGRTGLIYSDLGDVLVYLPAKTEVPNPFISLLEGAVVINKAAESVTVEENNIELLKKEYQIFLYLSEHKNETLNRTQITLGVWGENIGHAATLMVHIGRIRKKLGWPDGFGKMIRTIKGVGVALDDPILESEASDRG